MEYSYTFHPPLLILYLEAFRKSQLTWKSPFFTFLTIIFLSWNLERLKSKNSKEIILRLPVVFKSTFKQISWLGTRALFLDVLCEPQRWPVLGESQFRVGRFPLIAGSCVATCAGVWAFAAGGTMSERGWNCHVNSIFDVRFRLSNQTRNSFLNFFFLFRLPLTTLVVFQSP